MRSVAGRCSPTRVLRRRRPDAPIRWPRRHCVRRACRVRIDPVSGYFREHFWITTSGYFYDGPFRLTREMFGDDRLIFSVDYPLSDSRQARDWFDRLDLAPEVREKIAHGTVDNLLRLR
jgi:hypothetical protein